jgi:hypothetical protein
MYIRMKKLFIPLLFLSLMLPVYAHAKDVIPCDGITTPCDFNKFVDLVNNVINIIVIISIPAATVGFVWIGLTILTAQGNVGKITEAKRIAWNLMVGFIIILSAWLIVHIITSALLKPEFNIFMK